MRLAFVLILLFPRLAWGQIGPAPFTAAGTDIGMGMTAPVTGIFRTLSARASDTFNPLDYGAQANGIATAIGTKYGASLAALASFATVFGSSPYAWAINPAFGLTFSMTPSATSSTTAQTFIEVLTGMFPAYTATVALWQDPAHGNYALLPGMVVTGSCIASGTTLASVQRDPTAAGYGTITLSQAPASSCSSNTPLTFTIAPAQLQARTTDWLGWQAAMAQAWANPGGGHVHAPAGNYIVNGEIINAGGVTDSNLLTGVLRVSGDGQNETHVTALTDLGPDFALFVEVTRGGIKAGGRYLSGSEYRDMQVDGPPGWARTNGTFPRGTSKRGGMDGITLGSGAHVKNMTIGGFRAALNVLDDHGTIDDVTASNNGYGLYFAPFASVYGNWHCTLCGLSGNTVASVAVATTNAIDGSHFKNMNTGFQPYGFWLETSPPNVNNATGGNISNSVFDNVFMESLGNCFICSPNHNGGVTNTLFIGGVSMDVGQYLSNAVPGTTQAVDAIDVADFSDNTMEGTSWAPYPYLSDAVISSVGQVVNNMWINDTGFIFNSTGAVPPFKTNDHVQGNRFATSRGNGVFLRAQYSNIPAGTAVWDTGSQVLLPYQDGKTFAGLTTAPANGGYVGVVTEADAFQPTSAVGAVKADATQSCSPGQPVFATTGGIACGLDQTGAIGTSVNDLGTTAIIDLDPGQKGGATGSSTITAAGTSQATATAITSSMIIITTAAAATPPPGIMLQPVPVGSCVRVLQRGLNPVSVYPQVGSAIERNATNGAVLMSPGSDGQFCRTATTQWMH